MKKKGERKHFFEVPIYPDLTRGLTMEKVVWCINDYDESKFAI